MQGLVLLIEISIKKNIIHVVKDHNMDQKGKDNKSGKNLFWNISTYAHVSFHEIGFVSNLILFKETFVISRYKYWILYFFSCWEGKSFTCCK
jgi:citrate synthase